MYSVGISPKTNYATLYEVDSKYYYVNWKTARLKECTPTLAARLHRYLPIIQKQIAPTQAHVNNWKLQLELLK